LRRLIAAGNPVAIQTRLRPRKHGRSSRPSVDRSRYIRAGAQSAFVARRFCGRRYLDAFEFDEVFGCRESSGFDTRRGSLANIF
jgi:hypothetical protein